MNRARHLVSRRVSGRNPSGIGTATIRRQILILVTITIIQVAAGSTADADDRSASSIAEFVAARDRWDRMVGQPMTLEGRRASLSATRLRFLYCDLDFVLARSSRRPPSAKNIEVSGQLVRKGDGLVFRVSELKPRESDSEQLKLKRALVNSSRPDEIYDLAAWARQRGTFYDDQDLLRQADRLYREGLAIAHEHLEPGDVEGLRKLAATADKFEVDAGLSLRYLHQADRLEWEAALSADEPDYRRILGLIRQDLPGAMTPLPPERMSIRDDYRTAPDAVFRVAEGTTRKLLARAFYIEVALAEILASANPDGRDGYRVAERIERTLPELSALADEYRRRELEYLTTRVATLTRGRMVDLAERYEQRGATQQARQIMRDWLAGQEPQATEAGPTELMELGDEYINLLGDERAAGRLYKRAYQQNPQLTTARDWLSAHGYELRGTTWSRPGDEEDEMADAAIDAAIAEGRVQVGMSGAQVLKALGTKPSSSVRMAYSGSVAVLWVFEDYGITVRLQRRSTSSSAEVVEIGTTP